MREMLPAFFKHVLCVLKGHHHYIYTGRTYLGKDEDGKRYFLHYECSSCSHIRHEEEVEP